MVLLKIKIAELMVQIDSTNNYITVIYCLLISNVSTA